MLEWVVLAVILFLAVLIYLGLRKIVIRPLNQAVIQLNTIADADLTTPIPTGGKTKWVSCTPP